MELADYEVEILLDVMCEVGAAIQEDDLGLFSERFVKRYNELAAILGLEEVEEDDEGY